MGFVVCYLKLRFYCLASVARDFNSFKLLEFQNKMNIEIFKFYLMYFGFNLDASDIDF